MPAAKKPARWIEYQPVDSIVPADENPKAHDLDELLASVSRFRFVEPVIVDERTGKLVAGHGRIELLMQLEEVGSPPPSWPEEQSWPPEGVELRARGQWFVPVVRGWASEDDDEAAAYVIAANATPEAGGWKRELLGAQLSKLAEMPRGLDGTGYSNDKLDALLASLKPPTTPEPSPDPFGQFGAPPPPNTVDFRFGDYAGKVDRAVYDAFISQFEKRRSEGGEVLMDDVLTSWLGLRALPAATATATATA